MLEFIRFTHEACIYRAVITAAFVCIAIELTSQITGLIARNYPIATDRCAHTGSNIDIAGESPDDSAFVTTTSTIFPI